MRQIILMLGLVIALTMWTGCATYSHIEKLPNPDEFKIPLAQLKKKYPDLTRYQSPLITKYEWPLASPLKAVWGYPQRKGFSAWMLFPPSWIFYPTIYWYWDFEGKRVSALIIHPIEKGYKPHVLKLMVKDK
jgi:hypothetical protein